MHYASHDPHQRTCQTTTAAREAHHALLIPNAPAAPESVSVGCPAPESVPEGVSLPVVGDAVSAPEVEAPDVLVAVLVALVVVDVLFAASSYLDTTKSTTSSP
jgi:hypothetical protein